MPAARGTRWGYHRLSDATAERIVRASGVGAGDLVLDIGAGTGALTGWLLATGARVVAVELHPARASQLRDRFGPSLVVVRADAADLRLPRRPFRVVANPPFGVTTALLRRLLAPGSRLDGADLVLPAHAAARWAHGRGSGTGRWSPGYVAAVTARLPSGAFSPPAPTPTAVLRIERWPPAPPRSTPRRAG